MAMNFSKQYFFITFNKIFKCETTMQGFLINFLVVEKNIIEYAFRRIERKLIFTGISNLIFN